MRAKRLTKYTGFKVRPSELDLFRQAADAAEITISDLLRRAAVARAKHILRSMRRPLLS